MELLINRDNSVSFFGEEIDFGEYDEPNVNKWRIANGTCVYYAIGSYEKVLTTQEIPQDYATNKYCYTEEKGFFLNEDYHEPLNTDEEIKRLKQENTEFKAQLDNVQEVLDYLVLK